MERTKKKIDMDYEKKYNEALDWMRQLYPCLYGQSREDAERFFPELKESEDERIRMALIKLMTVAGEHYVRSATGFEKEQLIAWLEKQKEQKPAEKQDYTDLNDLESAIHRGFLSAGVENVPVKIIKETAQECLAQMKPAEWMAGQGWISIDESLPEMAQEVIVLTDEIGTAPIYKINFGHIVDVNRCIDYNGWNIPGVKYWMPCPKIPGMND